MRAASQHTATLESECTALRFTLEEHGQWQRSLEKKVGRLDQEKNRLLGLVGDSAKRLDITKRKLDFAPWIKTIWSYITQQRDALECQLKVSENGKRALEVEIAHSGTNPDAQKHVSGLKAIESEIAACQVNLHVVQSLGQVLDQWAEIDRRREELSTVEQQKSKIDIQVALLQDEKDRLDQMITKTLTDVTMKREKFGDRLGSMESLGSPRNASKPTSKPKSATKPR